MLKQIRQVIASLGFEVDLSVIRLRKASFFTLQEEWKHKREALTHGGLGLSPLRLHCQISSDQIFYSAGNTCFSSPHKGRAIAELHCRSPLYRNVS